MSDEEQEHPQLDAARPPKVKGKVWGSCLLQETAVWGFCKIVRRDVCWAAAQKG